MNNIFKKLITDNNVTLIIPKKAEIKKFLTKISSELKHQGVEVFPIPKFKTLLDLAKEYSEIDDGNDINKNEFNIILEHLDDKTLPVRFTNRRYKGFRAALFELFEQLSFVENAHKIVENYKSLKDLDITEDTYLKVKQIIESKGYYFKGKLFLKAMENIKSRKVKVNENYIHFISGVLTKTEAEFLNILKVNFYNTSNNKLFKYLLDGDRQDITESDTDRVKFFKTDSITHLSRTILSIYKSENKNIAIYTNSIKNANELYDILSSLNIPVNTTTGKSNNTTLRKFLLSIRTYQDLDIKSLETDFNYGYNNSTKLYIDLHNSKNNFTPKEIGYAIWDILKRENKDRINTNILNDFINIKGNSKTLNNFSNYINALSKSLNDTASLSKNFHIIKDILNTLSEITQEEYSDLYKYYKTVHEFLGDTGSITDILDVLINTKSLVKSDTGENDYNGVDILTAGDLIYDYDTIILTDTTDKSFLSPINYNHLLNDDENINFEKEIYKLSHDNFLKLWFSSLGTSDSKIYIELPQYVEDDVISSKIERLCKLYDKVEKKVNLIGDDNVNISNQYFPVTTSTLDSTRLIVSDAYMHDISCGGYKFSAKYSDDITLYLRSASRIESFMKCPAEFVSNILLDVTNIESDDTFRTGNFLHKFVEEFLSFYKGKNMLNETEYSSIRSSIKITKNKLLPIPTEVKRFVVSLFTEPEKEDIYSPIKSLIIKSNVFQLFDRYEEKVLKRDPNMATKLSREKAALAGFLFNLLIYMGPTPKKVTETFLNEVYFGNFKITDDVRIKEGYIDLVFVDFDNNIRIIDFKSGDISKYEDEAKDYRNVQLLIYSEAIKKGKSGDTDIFKPFKTPNRPHTILDDSFFSSLGEETEIKEAYLSSKNGGVVGIREHQDFETFIRKLNEKLSLKPTFLPERNKSCQYCNFTHLCDIYEDKSLNYDKEKFQFKDEKLDISKIENIEKKSSNNNLVNFIVFADSKKDAISQINNDIVISAGAGSGKTEVLSSKYIKLLLEGYSVESIVCITFTNKAAGEMKKRIIDKLQKSLAIGYYFSEKQDNPDNYKLNDNKIKLLQKAFDDFYKYNKIGTFHSFCKMILEKYGRYYQELGYDDINYEVVYDYKIKDFTIKKATQAYAEKFETYFNKYNTPKNSREILLDWLSNRNFYYDSSEAGAGGFLTEVVDLTTQIKKSGKWFDEWDYYENGWFKDFYDRVCIEHHEKIEKLKEQLAGYLQEIAPERIVELQENGFIKPTPARRKTDAPEILNIKTLIKELNDELKKLILNSHNYVDYDIELTLRQAVLSVCKGLYEDTENFKKSNGYITMEDYHVIAVKIIEDVELAREEIVSNFKYFLIDEFQDTNWLQERLLKVLSNDGKNRLFIVGDLKQSIYRFQQCDNQIFRKIMEKDNISYFSFKENYRSENDIVNFVNSFFGKNKNSIYNIFKDTSKDSNKPEYALPIKSKENRSKISFLQLIGKTPEKMDERLDIIAEANYIANLIRENSHIPYNSWGILFERYTNIGYLKKVLDRADIPYSIVIKKGLLKTDEVKEFIQILKVCAKISDISEIASIGNIQSIIDYGAENYNSGGLLKGAYSVLFSEDYFNHIVKFEDAYSRVSNIESFIEVLKEAIENVSRETRDIFTHIDSMSETDSEQINVSKDNSIKIMTIHSSKGLEFDNVIVAGISGHSKSNRGNIEFINKYERYGNLLDFSFKPFKNIVLEDSDSFITYNYLKEINKEFDIKESANLLYVAFTRAAKNLYVTSIRGEIKEDKYPLNSDNWLANIEQNLFSQHFDFNEVGTKVINYNGTEIELVRHNIEDIPEIISSDSEGKKRAKLFIPEKWEEKKSSSLSSVTSELKQETDNNSSYYYFKNNGYTATELGNTVHKFLETHLNDIISVSSNFTNTFEAYTVKEEVPIKQKKTAKSILLNVINNQDFISLFDSKPTIYTEKGILFKVDDEYIQGIVDLALEYHDKVLVVDYKTSSNLNLSSETLAKYKSQVESYCNALSKLFKKSCEGYVLVMNVEKSELIKVV